MNTKLVEDGFLDITPSDEGYASMARMFTEQIMRDVRKSRLEPDANLLAQVVQTVAYLGSKGRGDLIEQIIAAAQGAR